MIADRERYLSDAHEYLLSPVAHCNTHHESGVRPHILLNARSTQCDALSMLHPRSHVALRRKI